MLDNIQKYLVPIFVVAYGDNPEEAVEYVEHALDTTWFVGEDGIDAAWVLEEEVELYEEDY